MPKLVRSQFGVGLRIFVGLGPLVWEEIETKQTVHKPKDKFIYRIRNALRLNIRMSVIYYCAVQHGGIESKNIVFTSGETEIITSDEAKSDFWSVFHK
jgi:hypothetical protein